ncbi:MAG: SGNH/GDSL hydrolase family protein [Pseudomonadota bacterium]
MKTPVALSHVLLLAALSYTAQPKAETLPSHATQDWVGTWGTSPSGPPLPAALQTFHNQTLRLIVHTSIGGKRVRIRVSNERGAVSLRIGEAHLALRQAGADIVPGSDRALTFSAFAAITIPAGAVALSDAVELDVPALSDLAVSLHLPGSVAASTIHGNTTQTSYVSFGGNFAGAAVLPTERIIFSWPFLTEVDVQSAGSALVTLGDSITDGAATTRDANHRWPDFLALRLQAMMDPLVQRTDRLVSGHRPVGVVNRGIGGSRQLQDGPANPMPGIAALARFDRDVLATAGARHVIVLLGINDIGVSSSPGTPLDPALGLDELVASYRQLIARAHAKGLAIYGGTMTPFEGMARPGYYSPDKELVRQAANQWIRTGGEFDAVIDFDLALRDPSHPSRLLPAFDSGDHLHPNDLGMQALANAVPLTLFHTRGFAAPPSK